MFEPTFVVPSQAPVPMGPQRKNVTVPLGVFEGWLPLTVAVSWTAVVGVTGPAFDTCVVIVATQFPKLPRTKSFSSAFVDCEERVSARKLAKHSFAMFPSLDRLIPASRNSPVRYEVLPLLSTNGQGATTSFGLTSPQKPSASAAGTQFAASEVSCRCRLVSPQKVFGFPAAVHVLSHV